MLIIQAVKDWDVDEAKATGAKILSGKFVDHPQTERSKNCPSGVRYQKGPYNLRCCEPRGQCCHGGPLSGEAGLPVVELRRGRGSPVGRGELIFLEPPFEYFQTVGKQVLWQCLKVRERKSNGARNWQTHLCNVLTESECQGKSVQNP